MGRHYALMTGESAEIAQSVFEHYLPKGQSDDLPTTDVGAATAIADKIDMVCGCFGVGLIPTGDRRRRSWRGSPTFLSIHCSRATA